MQKHFCNSIGRYCCKSRKSPGDNFRATGQSDRRSSIFAASITLPRSTVSLALGDEVPRISTRKSRPRPGEFLISGAKTLLQQYRPESEAHQAAANIRLSRYSGPMRRVRPACGVRPTIQYRETGCPLLGCFFDGGGELLSHRIRRLKHHHLAGCDRHLNPGLWIAAHTGSFGPGDKRSERG